MRKLTTHMIGILAILQERKSIPTQHLVRSAMIGLAERGLITIGTHVCLTKQGRAFDLTSLPLE